ncbi:MAG: hypothetical protein ACXAE3_02690 [Candidatus Kariarchaeaceae archaeon]
MEDSGIKCPKCETLDIEDEIQSEYTGGGYRDVWYEYECLNCGNIWRGEVKSDYA